MGLSRQALTRCLPAALAALLSAVCLLLAVSPAPAGAVVVRLPSGGRVSYAALSGGSTASGSRRALDSTFSNVEYGGGPVMTSNVNLTLAWAPAGYGYQTGYVSGVNRFFADLSAASGSPGVPDAVSSQYNDAAGDTANYNSGYGGSLADTDAYPASGCPAAPGQVCLTDAQLESELDTYLRGHGLPADLSHEYFVLTPPNVAVCFDSAGDECSGNAVQNRDFCAYHGYTNSGFVYATVPDEAGVIGCDPFVTLCPNASCGYPNGPADGVLSALSHEHNESITDPQPGSGWEDSQPGCGSVGCAGEIGDKCNNDGFSSPTAQLGDNGAGHDTPYDVTLNGDHYLLQMEWSNEGRACLIGYAGDTTAVAAGFTESGLGTTVSFDAGASTGAAEYVWQFDDGPGLTTSVETSSPTITHTFASAGVYRVALTVMAADGTSNGSAAGFQIGGAAAPVPRFSFAPAPSSVGQAVAFDATASHDANVAGTLVAYSWNFGDGYTASGPTTSHAFARGGAHVVTLTVVNRAGMSDSLAEIVPVSAPPAAVSPTPAPAPSASPKAVKAVASTARSRACLVPPLRNRTLTAARRAIKAAHCSLGSVSQPRHRPRRSAGRRRRWVLVVVSQSRRPGHLAAKPGRISVRVAYRARRG